MRFHGYFRSSSSYRCRIAFGLKDLAPDFVPVHLTRDGGQHHTPAFRALNPQGLLPVLEVGDDLVLTQSPAILEWLDEVYPDPPLLPKDPGLRAQVRAFCAVIACEIHPLQNLRVLNHVASEYGADKQAWCQHWIGPGLAACEGLLAKRPVTRFAFGDAPGMAEVYLIPQMFSAQRFNVDTSAMPRLNAIAQACAEIPAFAAAHPARQPDAE